MTKAPAEIAGAAPLNPVQLIRTVMIDASDRLREVNPEYISELATSIEQIGLQQPVTVIEDSNGYRLVIGAHRLVAVRQLAWTEIPAFVVTGSPDELLLMEIDENLQRRELSPLERAVFLAERKRVYEVAFPETKHGAQGGRGGKKIENDIVSFSKNTQKILGLDKRTIERSCSIAEALTTEQRRALAFHPIAEKQNELLRMAALPKEERARAIELLTSTSEENPAPNSLQDAIDIIRGNRSRKDRPAKDKKFDAVLSAMKRAGKPLRRLIFEHFREEIVEWLDSRSDQGDA